MAQKLSGRNCVVCGGQLTGGDVLVCSDRCTVIFGEWERLPPNERPVLPEYYRQTLAQSEPTGLRNNEQPA